MASALPVVKPVGVMSLIVPDSLMAYSLDCVPSPVQRVALLSRQFKKPRHRPVICCEDRLRQPPMGRNVFSYQRTRLASYHRPAAWYSVPLR